jgi:hypothetical protein
MSSGLPTQILHHVTLVCVSDKKKQRLPEQCAKKDQSIHVFRIPS